MAGPEVEIIRVSADLEVGATPSPPSPRAPGAVSLPDSPRKKKHQPTDSPSSVILTEPTPSPRGLPRLEQRATQPPGTYLSAVSGASAVAGVTSDGKAPFEVQLDEWMGGVFQPALERAAAAKEAAIKKAMPKREAAKALRHKTVSTFDASVSNDGAARHYVDPNSSKFKESVVR